MANYKKRQALLTQEFFDTMEESKHHSDYWYDTKDTFFCGRLFKGKRSTWLQTFKKQRDAAAETLGKRLPLFVRIGDGKDIEADRQMAVAEHNKLNKLVEELRVKSLTLVGQKVGRRFVADMVEPRHPVDNPNYDALLSVLMDAYAQATVGKGAERHAAGGLDFEDQDLLLITKEVGLGFPTGQAIKKIAEGLRLTRVQARHEFLGAIVYLAGAIVHMDKE